jgi:hypothetical protein
LKFKPQYCQMKELQKHELEISNIILVWFCPPPAPHSNLDFEVSAPGGAWTWQLEMGVYLGFWWPGRENAFWLPQIFKFKKDLKNWLE